MKKILSCLSFIALICVYSCNSGGSGESYSIKMRLNKGDTFHHDINLNLTMNMAIIETKMNITTGIAFKVINNDSAEKELNMTYTNSHISMEMNKLSGMNMDSILNAANHRAVGKTVTVKLSADNEIIDIAGMENVIADSTDEATKQTIQKMFSKEQMNSLFGMMFSMYPKKPVKVGDSWKGINKVNMNGIDMSVNITYTLHSVKNGLADIDVKGVIDGKGQMNQRGMKIEMNMSGDQTGTYTVKLANGYLDNANYKMNMKADMEVMGQKMPMTMQIDCKMTGR